MGRVELGTSISRLFRASHCGAMRGLLCVALVAPSAPCAAKPKPQRPTAKATVPAMDALQRALHTLNRFTFGPTSGEEALVQRMGVDAWFREQLHPDSIPDGLLEARLAGYPAMQLTQAQLIQRFPSPGMLRQYSDGKLEAPADPLERAIYADAAFSYEEKKAAKNPETPAQPAMTAGAENTVGKANEAGATAPAPTTHLPAETADQASARAILALPPEARMGHLLAMTPEAMQSLRGALKGNGEQQLTAGMTPTQKEEVIAMQAPLRVVGAEALATRLLRDVYSERQLQAVMTDFWLNHFNVYDRKSQEELYLLPAYEQETILPHTLGRFEDLLVATAESPAMLMYLDNWTSVGPDSKAAGRPTPPVVGNASVKPAGKRQGKGINENYARELMELHTLGVNGGYTQDDVIEVAKCFTGWTLDPPAKGGGFTFNPNRHQPGPKTVLGHVIPEGGEDEGLAVLHLLATSPQTAHLLSLQLAERFVSDTPSRALVNTMTKAYLQHDGDISAVLLAMFHAPQFWSMAVYRAKVKTPVELVASALRASNADVSNPMPLLGAMNRLGMPVYGMQTPNGYSWQAEAWVSTNALVTRMNFALTLSGNHLAGTRLNWTGVLPAIPEPALKSSPDALEAALEIAILGEPANARTRAAVLSEGTDGNTELTAAQSFKAVPAKAEGGRATRTPTVSGAGGTPVTTMAGLLLGSPDFQRR